MSASALPTDCLATLGETIARAIGKRCAHLQARPVGGGCISRNFCLEGQGERYFVKLAANGAAMFAAEADGLAALARCQALVVPRVICEGRTRTDDFLVLEWLDLDAEGDAARLGEAVAALHDVAYPQFGWHGHNFIGTTPQANGWDDDWPRFFAERRLAPQLRLAAERGAPDLAKRAAPLLAALPQYLAGHTSTPGLVHGDLWSGNKGFVGGRPALFDPAVHAGDGEADLAMAELFGGFPPRFWAAYHALRPSIEGYETRRTVYQLYHVLNHFNLFGGGYARQAMALITTLLARAPRRA